MTDAFEIFQPGMHVRVLSTQSCSLYKGPFQPGFDGRPRGGHVRKEEPGRIIKLAGAAVAGKANPYQGALYFAQIDEFDETDSQPLYIALGSSGSWEYGGPVVAPLARVVLTVHMSSSVDGRNVHGVSLGGGEYCISLGSDAAKLRDVRQEFASLAGVEESTCMLVTTTGVLIGDKDLESLATEVLLQGT